MLISPHKTKHSKSSHEKTFAFYEPKFLEAKAEREEVELFNC